MTELMEQLRIDAAQRPVSGEEESDDNLVRLWQDELRGAQEKLAGLAEIPVASMDRSFASIRKEYLTVLAPELAIAIPKKSHLWADWSVWNFKRHRLDRAKALPAEAVHRARGSLTHFDRLEVWQAVGTADPWLVGVVRTPNGRERFYLVYDWGVETSAGRDALR